MKMKHVLMSAVAALMLAPFAASAQGVQDIVVDKNGQPVYDARGNCVLTKWVVGVDSCKMGKRDLLGLSKEARTVYFDFNKSSIRASEKAKLDSLVKAIKGSKEVSSVDIVGFADRIGGNSYNDRLSKKRAQSVKSYLWNNGVKTRKVDLKGLGEKTSVTKCDDKLKHKDLVACLAADRRVEIELNFAK